MDKCNPSEILPTISQKYDVRDTKENKCVSCTLNFLSQYYNMAVSDKPSDQQIDSLLDTTKNLIKSAIVISKNRFDETHRRLGYAHFYLKDIEGGLHPSEINEARAEFGDALKHYNLHHGLNIKLNDMSGQIPNAKSRLDKIVVIEQFANLSHDHGFILPEYGCGCTPLEENDPPSQVAHELAQFVFNCLAS